MRKAIEQFLYSICNLKFLPTGRQLKLQWANFLMNDTETFFLEPSSYFSY
jgi:hypothetical protein